MSFGHEALDHWLHVCSILHIFEDAHSIKNDWVHRKELGNDEEGKGTLSSSVQLNETNNVITVSNRH